MPSKIPYLSVTFNEDTPLGPIVMRTGETVSLPESFARGFGNSVTINGVGSVSAAPGFLKSADADSTRTLVSGDGISWLTLPTTGDAAAQLNALIAEHAAERIQLRIGPGDYNCDGPIYWVSGMRVYMHPMARLIRRFYPGGGIAAFVDQQDKSTDSTDVEWIGGQIVQGATAYGGNVIGGRLRRAVIKGLVINGYGSATQTGRAISAIVHDGHISGLRILNPSPREGVGGIRLLGGSNTVVSRCYVESGDDCFQFVPAITGLYGNAGTINCSYQDCWGISYAAKLCTVANTDRNDTLASALTNDIKDIGFHRIRGTHYGVGVQIDVSGDTTGGISNVVLEDIEAEMSAAQAGAFSSLLVTVDDGVSGVFNGRGIDGLHIVRGKYAGSRKQTLSIIDQTSSGTAKIRNIVCSAELGAPRDTDKTVEVQSCDGLTLAGVIEGHPESISVVKLGGVGKLIAADVTAKITGIGGASGHTATAFGVQLFSGVARARVSAEFVPTTSYTTTDARAVQVNTGASGVSVRGADGRLLTAAKRLRVTANGAAAGAYTVESSSGLQDTAQDPVRIPLSALAWVCPIPPFAAANTVAVPAVDVLYLAPAFVEAETSIDTAGLRVVTPASAGGIAKIGIWRNTSRAPGACVAVTGDIATTAAGVPTGAIVATLQRGWYWVGVVCSVALPATKAVAATSPNLGGVVGGASIGEAIPGGLTAEFAGYSTPLAYSAMAALPDLTAATLTRLTAAAVPVVAWRVA